MGRAVQLWLGAQPDLHILLENLPALELALAGHVNNPENDLFSLGISALKRLDAGVAFGELSNSTLASLLNLNLDARLLDAVREAAGVAANRYDDTDAFFRADAADTSGVFYTAPNAQLSAALYRAWRMLDDKSFRSMAGEVLSVVSAMFDTGAGLFERKQFPDGTRTGSRSLAVYAAALEMFLTAQETTGRGTYIGRGCIVANYALEHLALGAAPGSAQVAFADKLMQLDQQVPAPNYRGKALALLETATALPANSIGEQAQLALALARAQIS